MATWQNWSKTIDFRASEIIDVTTLSQLTKAVATAAQGAPPQKRSARAVGSGHSWSLGAVPGHAPYAPGIDTHATLIDTSAMHPKNCAQDGYLKATYFQDETSAWLVAIPPGTTQGWLATNAANAADDAILEAPYRGYDPDHRYSNEHPALAAVTMGPAPDITLGGFVANGCHGTGFQAPPFGDLLEAAEVVIWDGTSAKTVSYATSEGIAAACVKHEVFDSTPTVDAEAIGVLRCGLGAPGVLSKLVLGVAPSFNVQHINEYVDNDTLWKADYLETLVTSCDYLELFWFPYNSESWVMRYKRTDAAEEHVDQLNAFVEINGLLASATGGLLGDLFGSMPSLTPLVMEAVWTGMKWLPGMNEVADVDFNKDFAAQDKPVVADLWKAYLYQLKYFTDLLDISYTVPIPTKTGGGHDFSHVVSAWQAASSKLDAMQQAGKYPLNLTLHARFIKDSDSFLSPARWAGNQGTHTCYIEFLSFSETDPDVFAEYATAVGNDWFSLGGLPHWAKAFQIVQGATPAAHERLVERSVLASVKQLIDSCDPDGLFKNDFLHQLLDGAAMHAREATKTRDGTTAQEDVTTCPTKTFAVPSASAWNATAASLASTANLPRRGPALLLGAGGLGLLRDGQMMMHPLTYHFDAEALRAQFWLHRHSKFLSVREVFALIGHVLDHSW